MGNKAKTAPLLATLTCASSGLYAMDTLGQSPGEVAAVNQAARVCTDESRPTADRLASCKWVIDSDRFDKPNLAKIYVSRARAYRANHDNAAALRDLNLLLAVAAPRA